MQKFKLGAMSPPNSEWEIGKTAATISFVKEAEKFLLTAPRVSPVKALEAYTARLKSGQEILTEFKTVEEFLTTGIVAHLG